MRIIIFLAVAVALGMAGYGVSEVFSQHRQITTFRPVEVTVLSSKVEPRISRGAKGRKRTRYIPVIAYRYEVEGREYRGGRISPRLDDTSRSWANRVVNRYREGRVYPGFYDPRNPADSFLIPHYSFVPYVLVLLPAAGLGLGCFFGMLYSAQRPAPPTPWAGGWFEIPLQRSVARKLRVALGTAVGWHVAGLLVAAHYFGAATPPYEVMGVLSASIYEALGIIPVVAALYWHLLKRNAGDARLTLNLERPRPGDQLTARVEQEIRGDLEIEALRVGLVCERLIRVRSGRRSTTQAEVCLAQWVSAFEGRHAYPGETLLAEVKLEVPPQAEPSTPALRKEYPRYRWRIALHTRITGSPDYRADFPLTVDPRQAVLSPEPGGELTPAR